MLKHIVKLCSLHIFIVCECSLLNIIKSKCAEQKYLVSVIKCHFALQEHCKCAPAIRQILKVCLRNISNLSGGKKLKKADKILLDSFCCQLHSKKNCCFETWWVAFFLVPLDRKYYRKFHRVNISIILKPVTKTSSFKLSSRNKDMKSFWIKGGGGTVKIKNEDLSIQACLVLNLKSGWAILLAYALFLHMLKNIIAFSFPLAALLSGKCCVEERGLREPLPPSVVLISSPFFFSISVRSCFQGWRSVKCHPFGCMQLYCVPSLVFTHYLAPSIISVDSLRLSPAIIAFCWWNELAPGINYAIQINAKQCLGIFTVAL